MTASALVNAGQLTAPAAPQPKDAAEAARQFEAILIAQMLRGAHEESEGDSTGDSMWDLAAQKFSQLLADNGGLGLGKLISAGLKKAG